MCPKVTSMHKTEVKERIINAAIESFSQTGFDRTKMDDIAKSLDLSKGTLYLYFESKEDLFMAICEYHHKQSMVTMATMFNEKESILADAEAIYDNLRRIMRGTEKLMFEMLVESARNPRLRKAMYDHRLKICSAIVEQINMLVEKGFLRKDLDVEGLASAFVALYDGLTASKMLGFDEPANKKAWLAMIRTLVSGD
ncbi:MAG: hypothetical protein DA330_09675 [Nitrososphaera sp.]|nr:hypothetical protein [Nitrososphaera sp.]